jgi:hypothetical protein
VPLDRQIDYLSLDYGMKFEVPFDAKIVFSTNLAPETLGDEAFFRRIQSKILIPSINDDQFDEVLRRVATAMGVEVPAGAPAHLRHVSQTRGDGDLRPYLPGAVCKILRSICSFAKLPVVLDNDMIDRVAGVYFTHGAATRGDAAPPSLGALAALAARTPAPAPTTGTTAVVTMTERSPTAPAAPLLADDPAASSARVDRFLSGPPTGAPPPAQERATAPAGPSWAIVADRGDAPPSTDGSPEPAATAPRI